MSPISAAIQRSPDELVQAPLVAKCDKAHVSKYGNVVFLKTTLDSIAVDNCSKFLCLRDKKIPFTSC